MDHRKSIPFAGSECSLELFDLMKQFFCCTPVKEIVWKDDVLHKLCNDPAYQSLLLDSTVNHPVVKKFGVKQTYQQAFIKHIIIKVESSGQEVLDELYTTYCDLLSGCSDDVDTHYRHFIVGCHGVDCVTLKESSKVVSQGTTGLCSWQASLALADWSLHNYQYFHGKRILELGSGVGLTGLVISLCCQPSSYWFSDCHPSVLQMLQSNIVLNTTRTNSESLNTGVVYRTHYNKVEIGVLDLPWEDVPTSEITQHILPDLVLAADVVFDSRLFKPLCEAFVHLLKKPCSLLLACTVRSGTTLDLFLEMLRSQHLEIQEEHLSPPKYIFYSNTVPIKLYHISSKLSSQEIKN